MSTPHNMANPEQIAPLVLMPGDPLRAEYIANEFLESATTVNTVRNMLGFTGLWKGTPVTVMPSGMGMPSIGIYSWELFEQYRVESIIRVGTTGSIREDLGLLDIVAAQGTCTDSNYLSLFNLPGMFAPIADYSLLSTATALAKERGMAINVGNILSTDHFYYPFDTEKLNGKWSAMGVMAIEMESAALYANAAYYHRKALTLCTVTDDLVRDRHLSPAERVQGVSPMIELALDTIIRAK